MPSELVYQMALTLTPHIGCVVAKKLVEHFGSAQAIYTAKESHLSLLEGIGSIRAKSIKAFSNFDRCEQELKFIEKNNIQPLFLNDAAYPQRLLQCYDSPTLLFYKGTANLNASKIISIIGTRNCTDYGKAFTDKITTELAAENVTIVSGMAYGIDTIAHKAAVKNSLSTVGVLAHGLGTLYPPENVQLARQMINDNGGLLTEFMSGTKPDKHNFPTRNRVVAAIADATIVVETDIRGGSMITAELANNYNRDVFAVPGKTTDAKSRGCNHLIRQNKAALLTSAQELLEMMNWQPLLDKKKNVQRQLFIELTKEEKLIFDLMNTVEQIQLDQLYLKSGLTSSAVAGALLSLELQNVVQSLPGKVYKVL
jgi:DNA processing protein